MIDIKIVDLGMGSSTKEPHLSINRPFGMANYIFLHFRTPFEIAIPTGNLKCNPGYCIILEPYSPHKIIGNPSGYCDDWCLFNGEDTKKWLEFYQLPVNHLFKPKNTGFIKPAFKAISAQFLSSDEFAKNETSLLFLLFLNNLAKSVTNKNIVGLSVPASRHRSIFTKTRKAMFDNIKKQWTIDELSAMSDLSPSRFNTLYNEIFHVSPAKDLILMRINAAKQMLTNRNRTVSAIAEECGFSDIHYFSRMFRQVVGRPPREYAKEIEKNAVTKISGQHDPAHDVPST